MRRVLLALALLPFAVRAQEATAPRPGDPPPKPAREPKPVVEVRHEVRLRSGTTLVGLLQPERWKIRTAFGELEVPSGEIKSVRFGRRSDAERVEYVRRLIADLASSDPDRRARARAALKQEGAFAALDLKHTAREHEDPEVKRVCEELLDELDLDEEDYIPDEDGVETTRFSLSGTIVPTSFRVVVPEIGAINVRRRDIVRIRAYAPNRLHKFTLSAQNSFPDAWLDTGLAIERGQMLKITAEGTIHYPQWGNQMFGPDGNMRMGHINSIPIGALCGRIGAGGPVFRIGRQYKAKAGQSGHLFLCLMIHANMRGQPNSGEYTVRLHRGDE